MSKNDTPKRSFNLARLLPMLAWIAVLLVIVVVGYMIVSAIMALSSTPASVLPSLGTQAQQFIDPESTIIASPQTIVLEMQDLEQLVTASYSIEKVIIAERSAGFLNFWLGDRLLLVAYGEVTAGVDLTKMTEDDIVVDETSVTMIVPAAEIFDSFLDVDKTEVYDRETGWSGPDKDLETEARREAVRLIEEAAEENGILDMAETNAEKFFENLLKALGFEDVAVSFAPR